MSVNNVFDDKAGTEARERERLRRGWETWLQTFRWDFFVTGTLEQPVTASTLQRVVTKWLAAYPEAYAAVGVQRGPFAKKNHVHLLIGGIRAGGLAETHLRGSWVKNGHVKIEGFKGGIGGTRYLVEQADEIELLGSPQPFTPQRKRSGRK